jgi:hypothetical protein
MPKVSGSERGKNRKELQEFKELRELEENEPGAVPTTDQRLGESSGLIALPNGWRAVHLAIASEDLLSLLLFAPLRLCVRYCSHRSWRFSALSGIR